MATKTGKTAKKTGTKPGKNTWGGARKGAGRKPGPGPRRTPHRARPVHRPSQPMQLTLRALPGLPSLRGPALLRVIRECVAEASGAKFRVADFTVERDRLQVVVTASGTRALSSGARGLAIRTARQLNRQLGRTGMVWGDRYQARALTGA